MLLLIKSDTHAAPVPRLAPRLLLVKSGPDSGKKIAGQAGYAFYGGRWHKISADKPAPKGAPVAAHPESAGKHDATQHFTDDQWAALRLPDDNVNAPSFNKALDKLREWSDAGNVTAIVGAGYGSNTYGKKLTTIANHLLGLHGSDHLVMYGQKAGSHAAAMQEPQAPHPSGLPDHLAKFVHPSHTVTDVTPPGYGPEPEAPTGKADGPLKGWSLGAAVEAKPTETLKEWAESHPNAKVKAHAQAALDAKQPAAAGPLKMPDFQEGKTTTGVKALYEKVAQKVIDHGYAGNVVPLMDMVDASKKMWHGKTPNSKKLVALHQAAYVHAKGPMPAPEPEPAPVPAPAPAAVVSTKPAKIDTSQAPVQKTAKNEHVGKLAAIPWDAQLLPASNSNAGSHNKAVAKIKAMALAGDTAGLQAFVDSKAGAKQTYAKKQALLAQTALAAVKEGGAPAVAKPDAAPASPPAAAKTLQQIGQEKAEALAKLKASLLAAGVPHADGTGGPLLATNHGGMAKTFTSKADAVAAAADLYEKKGIDCSVSGGSPYLITLHAVVAPPAAKPARVKSEAKKKPVVSTSFVNTNDGHNKFWSVSVNGNTLKTEYGKIGTKGQSTTKVLASPAAAIAEKAKLMKQKQAGGYKPQGSGVHVHEVGGGAASTAKPDDAGWSFMTNDPGFSGANTAESSDGFIAFSPGDGAEYHDVSSLASSTGEPVFSSDTLKGLVSQLVAEGKDVPPLHVLQKLDPGFKASDMQIGPKEGDTKPGADGMLVLKNGHWVKVDPAYKKLTPTQAISIGKFYKTTAGNKAQLKALAVAGDGPGLHEWLAKHEAKQWPASKGYAKALLAVMGTPGETAAPAPAPAAPAPSAGGMPAMDAWAQTGPQAGSNPGGKFRDAGGQEYYCKFPGDADTAKSEVLAAKLYALAGLAGQDAQLVTRDGKVGIASKWTTVKKAGSAAALAKVDGVREGFAVDAWLGNWDVVGMSLDNLQVGPDGKAHRVDAGGSLEYRAQGDKKPFGNKVDEVDTLRDKEKNPHAAAVFGKMTKADITASVSKVLAISDVAIRAMVNEHGPGDAAAKKKLADTLIARKADLAAKYPAAAKKKKAIVFDPAKVSAPPSFLNWGGTGSSGPSSKDYLNKANEDAVQAIFKAAKTGDLAAIQKLSFPVFNKETGAVTGNKPVLDHPSQHVKGYAQQAVNEINYQMNPPKKFRFEGGHPLNSLNAAYPAVGGGSKSAGIQALAKFVVLGNPGAVSLADLALPPKTTHSEAGGTMTTATYAAAAKAALAKMPTTQQQAIKSYTGSGYHEMNGSLWSGNPSGAAKAAGEALKTLGHDITPGTILSRKISISGSSLDALLASTGKVLQEPAIMSTSIRPSSWSGNVHLKLHVGPGVKGLWVGKGSKPDGGALSSHSSEDELILPPGTRLLILGTKKGSDPDGFGKSSAHIVEAVILPT